MKVDKLDQLFDILRSKPKRRLVAAFANDAHTIEAVSMAVDMGIIDGTLVGDEATIKKVCAEHNINQSKFKIVQEADEMKAAHKSIIQGDYYLSEMVQSDCKYELLSQNLEKQKVSK